MFTSLSVNNIFLRESSGAELLKNIKLGIEPVSLTVLRGPSGSGKSALMEILSLRRQPSSGSLLYNDEDCLDMPKRKLRHLRALIGYIPEQPVFLENLSVYENLCFVMKIEKISRKCFFDRIMKRLKPAGLISRRDIPVSSLSSTERKHLALSMALEREPYALFCDLNLSGDSDCRSLIGVLKEASACGLAVAVTAREGAHFSGPGIHITDMENGSIK